MSVEITQPNYITSNVSGLIYKVTNKLENLISVL